MSLITTILGIVAVFIILSIMAVFVYLLKFLNRKKVVILEETLEKLEYEYINEEDNEEIIAAIMAAISIASNVPLNKLRIKNIRKISRWE